MALVFHQSATMIGVRMNLTPPVSPFVRPAAMTSVPGSMTGPSPARTVGQAIGQSTAAPSSGDLGRGGFWSSELRAGSDAPPAPSSQAPVLASLPPIARSALKIAPFVAAVFFANKGDYVLAGVSAAAGAFAVWRL